MTIIPMCACNLPAKVYSLQLPEGQSQVPFCSYFGCRKANGGCGTFMWCKVKDMNDPNDEDGVDVYDALVLTNTELDAQNKELKERNEELEDTVHKLEMRIMMLPYKVLE